MKDNNIIDLAWNAPGSNNDNKPKDPSSSGPKEGPSYNGNNDDPWARYKKKQQGFDLNKFLNMLKKALFGGGSNNSQNKGKKSTNMGLTLVLAALLGIYIFTGFYTVKEAERGVVLRFGKVYDVVEPGLRWKMSGIDSVHVVDIEQVRAIQSSGSMLTEDENVVIVEMDVQYRISDPVKYLFSVTDPDNSLTEATDSALRYVVGHTMMDDILTSGREMVRQNTKELLVSIIDPYNMGLSVVDVNFLPARAPEQVKEAFDDAIAAQEDEQRFKREAEAYANEVLPRAEGQVQRILNEAQGYKSQVVLKAQGEVARFEQILPEFNAAPDITRTRIYLETMQEVLSKASKVIVDNKGGQSPVLYMPMPSMMQSNVNTLRDNEAQGAKSESIYAPSAAKSNNESTTIKPLPNPYGDYNNAPYQRGIR